eukprot:SAG22_NODE_602_length_8663_cov_17.617936_1_plen_163_part_10
MLSVAGNPRDEADREAAKAAAARASQLPGQWWKHGAGGDVKGRGKVGGKKGAGAAAAAVARTWALPEAAGLQQYSRQVLGWARGLVMAALGEDSKDNEGVIIAGTAALLSAVGLAGGLLAIVALELAGRMGKPGNPADAAAGLAGSTAEAAAAAPAPAAPLPL